MEKVNLQTSSDTETNSNNTNLTSESWPDRTISNYYINGRGNGHLHDLDNKFLYKYKNNLKIFFFIDMFLYL
jgi:hypothetical protein